MKNDTKHSELAEQNLDLKCQLADIDYELNEKLYVRKVEQEAVLSAQHSAFEMAEEALQCHEQLKRAKDGPGYASNSIENKRQYAFETH